MKPVLYLSLLLPACSWAEQPADRPGVEKLVASLNDAQARLSRQLFSPGADPAEINALWDLQAHMQKIASQPWSEVTAPRITTRKVLFEAPGRAVVDAAISQYGPVLVRSHALRLILERRDNQWRIASVRIVDSPLK